MRPTVSVVIPTYNQPALLIETLGTVFNQSLSPSEVIVVDDGSADETAAALARFRSQLSGEASATLHVIRQANSGIGPARDRGIAAATGEFVALLDHDDLWRSAKLEAQAAFLQSHPNCVAASVPWAYSTTPDEPIFDIAMLPLTPAGIVKRPWRALADGQSFFCTSTLMFRRAAARGLRHGDRPNCIEDRPFHIGLLARGEIGMASSDILAIYRIHEGNTSAETKASMKRANYYSNGLALLRELQAAGTFHEVRGERRNDLNYFLSILAMHAIRFRAAAGDHDGALAIYRKEFGKTLRFGSKRFLVSFPVRHYMPGLLERSAPWRARLKRHMRGV